MTAIYYDANHPGIYIEDIAQAFPPRTLTYVINPDSSVEIWIVNHIARVVGPMPFGWIKDESGDTFATTDALAAYLDSVTKATPSPAMLNAEYLTAIGGAQTVPFDFPNATLFAWYLNGLRQTPGDGISFGPSGLYVPASYGVIAGDLIQVDLFQTAG